jgi:hypothetical protein
LAPEELHLLWIKGHLRFQVAPLRPRGLQWRQCDNGLHRAPAI